MKKKISLGLGLGLLMGLCVLAVVTQAQEKKADLYLIYDILVNPSKVMEFEKALKEEFAIYAKHGARLPESIASTDDFHYYLLAPMDNFAGIDDLYKGFGEAHQKMGKETYQAILKSFKGTYESVRGFMWYLRNDLSYFPKNARLKPEEVKFFHYNFFYIKSGMQPQVEEIAKKFKALYESKNILDSYYFWVGDIGTNSPVFCVVSPGKSAVDFYAQSEKRMKLLGKEAMELNLKALALIRKIERKVGMPRPDLLDISKKE